MPPVGENLVFSATTGFVLSIARSLELAGFLLCLVGIAVVTALVYLGVRKSQKDQVSESIDVLFTKLTPCDPKVKALKKVAKSLVEPDFIPRSFPNKITWQRLKDRQSMADLINEVCQLNGSDQIKETDFFPPDVYPDDTGKVTNGTVKATKVLFTIASCLALTSLIFVVRAGFPGLLPF